MSLNHEIHHRFPDPADEEALMEHEDRLDPHCEFCNHRVDPSHDYRRVSGWLRAGSWDGFKRDEYEDSWAHKACIEIAKTVGVNQGVLDV